jgi:hypothetical protein
MSKPHDGQTMRRCKGCLYLSEGDACCNLRGRSMRGRDVACHEWTDGKAYGHTAGQAGAQTAGDGTHEGGSAMLATS